MELNPDARLTRWELMAGLAATAILYGCSERRVAHGSDAPGLIIPSAADANAIAVRGQRIQEVPQPPITNNWYAGQFVNAVRTDLPNYAGTLDDGPSPYNTETILRAAEKYGVFLTFFVVGDMVRAFPDILRRIYDAGHQIGNHSEHHTPYTSIGLAPQVATNQEIIKSVIGGYPTASRAPGLTRGQVYMDAVRNCGLYEVHTTWATSDSIAPRIPTDEVLREHMSGLKKGGIELNHDGGNIRPTTDAYDRMLEYSRNMGITSVTMDELMNSGIALPISGAYPPIQRVQTTSGVVLPGNACNFDVYSALVDIKKNAKLNRPQMSNVKEVLADLDILRAS